MRPGRSRKASISLPNEPDQQQIQAQQVDRQRVTVENSLVRQDARRWLTQTCQALDEGDVRRIAEEDQRQSDVERIRMYGHQRCTSGQPLARPHVRQRRAERVGPAEIPARACNSQRGWQATQGEKSPPNAQYEDRQGRLKHRPARPVQQVHRWPLQCAPISIEQRRFASLAGTFARKRTPG